jgi:hypothetical protein
MTTTTDARALIAEARKHDEAMTEAPWEWDDKDDAFRHIDELVAFGEPISEGNHGIVIDQADARGIAWLRTNLRALLDGYAEALEEAAGITRAHAHICKELDEREQQREDSARWLDERVRRIAELTAEVERLRLANSSLAPGAVLTAVEMECLRAERDAARVERDTTRDEVRADVLRLTETARAASENWMTASRERDEARAEVERMHSERRLSLDRLSPPSRIEDNEP